ncbi:hypothetical protein XENOCAPTIV_017884 [Xenoophorus captivus]|uniref:Uncharacterized protein n=1 Tax=Xenoophorus captivus TaxID=1517983 RepID=A0ABV0S944_9TELE
MEAVYTQGIWIAEYLQQRTQDLEHFWLTITHIGDPKAAFLLVFPLTYFVCKRAGVAVLWVAALSEWLNLVFKWESIRTRNDYRSGLVGRSVLPQLVPVLPHSQVIKMNKVC